MQLNDEVGLRRIGDECELMQRIDTRIEAVVRTQAVCIFLVSRVANEDAVRVRQQGWQRSTCGVALRNSER